MEREAVVKVLYIAHVNTYTIPPALTTGRNGFGQLGKQFQSIQY